MKKTFTILLILICFNSFGVKKNKLAYKPILNTNIDQSFPNAAAILVTSFKIGLEEFDYGNKTLKSTWYEYLRGISRHRCKFSITIDENNTLDIRAVDIQWWYSSNSRWEDSSEGLFSKKEEKIRASFAESLRLTNSNADITSQNQSWFFKDLGVNTLFFESATDLAGDRWFEHYLKDQEVKWDLTFLDIEKNNKPDYKYKEKFIYTTQHSLLNLARSKFQIVKYTNSDANVLTKKGNKKELKGYCRALEYNDGMFYVVTTDRLEEKLPSKEQKDDSKTQSKSVLEVAGKLKQLKELLDMGAITESEFKAEKDRLLNN